MALEMIEQVPDVDAIIIPTGGAGLIAGKCSTKLTASKLNAFNLTLIKNRYCRSSQSNQTGYTYNSKNTLFIDPFERANQF